MSESHASSFKSFHNIFVLNRREKNISIQKEKQRKKASFLVKLLFWCSKSQACKAGYILQHGSTESCYLTAKIRLNLNTFTFSFSLSHGREPENKANWCQQLAGICSLYMATLDTRLFKALHTCLDYSMTLHI